MAKKGRTVIINATVSEAMQDGVAELQALAEEMAEWRDNLEERLSHTDKYERVSECADVLESAASEIESTAQELDNELSRAATSVTARAGCPKHIAGTACERCGWNGEPIPGVPADSPQLLSLKAVVFDHKPESTAYLSTGVPQMIPPIGYYGRVGHAHYRTEQQFIEAREESEALIRKLTASKLPKEKQDRLAQECLFEHDEDILVRSFPVQRVEPYAGRKQSRADRRDYAVNLLTMAAGCIIEALDDWESARDTEREARDAGIDPQQTDGEEKDEEERRHRIEEIRANADELIQKAEEASEAEFPGMYG
jgi:hypothetical protein